VVFLCFVRVPPPEVRFCEIGEVQQIWLTVLLMANAVVLQLCFLRLGCYHDDDRLRQTRLPSQLSLFALGIRLVVAELLHSLVCLVAVAGSSPR